VKTRYVYKLGASVFVSRRYFDLHGCLLEALEVRRLLLLLISFAIFTSRTEILWKVIDREIGVMQGINETVHLSMGLCAAA
jgi:hypothetical protein